MPRDRAAEEGHDLIPSREEAIAITAASFPDGPEALQQRLGIEVEKSPMRGVEGWCIQGVRTRIRINSRSSNTRQRFTLAHELAHLILGTEPDIATEPFRSDRREERDADALAAEFLIPDDQLKQSLAGHVPVDAGTLKRLSRAAKVSPVMVACRVVNAADELDIQNAAVVFFRDGAEEWRYSTGLRFSEANAVELWRLALDRKPELVRAKNRDSKMVVGSVIDTNLYQVLFVQLLDENDAQNESAEERRRRLRYEVFHSNHSFMQSVSGALSVVKSRCQGLSLTEAESYFYARYVGTKYEGSEEASLRSESGRQYVRQSLSRWFQ